MDDERTFLKKRFSELAEQSAREYRYRYTEFLSLYELSIFYEMEKELSFAEPKVFGGCDMAERCMIRFGMEEMGTESEEFPISILEIKPSMPKFAQKLSHRDYLGSILGLGLKREKIGDIFVRENSACVFVNESVESFIIAHLDTVSRTKVTVCKVSAVPGNLQPRLLGKEVLVSSNRVDSIIAKLYGLSRDEALRLIKNGSVFINGRMLSKNAAVLQENQIVSVRGYGKFIFDGEGNKTRKDKLYVHLSIYG